MSADASTSPPDLASRTFGDARRARRSLLELDVELGALVPRERLHTARTASIVTVQRARRGVWDLARIAAGAPEHPGLFVVDGFLARDVVVGDAVATELLGPGDLIRPWRQDNGPSVSPRAIQWTVLDDAQVALLDQRFAARTAAFPEIGTMLLDRLNRRVERLAMTHAITSINGVDRRILAELWNLAFQWGRVTSRGTVLPLTISHRMLAQLIGARRPTVSVAIASLAVAGELERLADGSWLLTGDHPVDDDLPARRVVPPRRHFVPRTELEPASTSR